MESYTVCSGDESFILGLFVYYMYYPYYELEGERLQFVYPIYGSISNALYFFDFFPAILIFRSVLIGHVKNTEQFIRSILQSFVIAYILLHIELYRYCWG